MLAIVPAAPTVSLLEKLALELVETSKPVGAVTVIPAVMSAPDTLKLEVVDAEPTDVLSALGAPVNEITGLDVAASVRVMSPLLDIARVVT